MYSLHIYASNCGRPIGFFVRHTRIVITMDGIPYRYDVFHRPVVDHRTEQRWGYLHLNLTHPTLGIRHRRSTGKPRKTHLLQTVQLTVQDAEILLGLQKKIINYPRKDQYHLRGPNSNSFTQWVLDNSGLVDFLLPWKAHGRMYHRKNKRE